MKLLSQGAVRKGQTQDKDLPGQGMGKWPLFPVISVSVFKVMVSTCQSNAVYCSVVLQKIYRNCLCDTFVSSVL